MQLLEESKTGKLEKLFECIDSLKDIFVNEVSNLHIQLENVQEKLAATKQGSNFASIPRPGGMRSTSTDIDDSRKPTKPIDERRNNSSATIAAKTADKFLGKKETGFQLIDSLHLIVNSVEKYREICPPSTMEARLVHKKLISELESAFSQARTINSFVQDFDKLQNIRGNVDTDDQRSHGFDRLEQNGSLSATHAANGLIQSLQVLNRKLERKCEDRKISLKKLYCIVLEKDKQLKEACGALEKFKIGANDLMRNFEFGGKEFQKKIEHLDSKLTLISNVSKGIFEGFPFIQTDGSLDYSMTRRYETFHKSILSGNKYEDNIKDRKSYESKLNLQIEEPHLQENKDPIMDLEEPIRDILDLARERFSFSEDEDISSNLVVLLKVARDWAFLVDSYGEEMVAKERAIAENAKILESLDERERVHAAVWRDYSNLKEESSKQITALKLKLEKIQGEAAATTIENDRFKVESYPDDRKLRDEGLPPLHGRPGSRSKPTITNPKQNQRETSVQGIEPELELLRNENEKLYDKLSIITVGMEGKLIQLDSLKQDVNCTKEWIEQIKKLLAGFKSNLDSYLDECFHQSKVITSSLIKREAVSKTKINELEANLASHQSEVKRLNQEISLKEKLLQEQRETFDLSLTMAVKEAHQKVRELEDNTSRIVSLEEEVERLRKLATSIEISPVGRKGADHAPGLLLESMSLDRQISPSHNTEEYKADIETMRNQIDELRLQLDQCKSENIVAQSEKDDTEKLLFEANTDKDALRNQAIQASRDMEKIQTQYKEVLMHNQELEGTIDQLEDENRRFISQLEDLKTKLSQRESDKQLERSQQTSKDNEDSQIMTLEEVIADLKGQVNAYESQVLQLKTEIDDEREAHTKKIEALGESQRIEYEALKRENNEFKEVSFRVAEEKKLLEGKCAEIEEKCSEKV